MAFDRSTATKTQYWCIGVFSESVTHSEAEKKCSLLNSKLTAFESDIEVEDVGKRVANVTKGQDGLIWTGMLKKSNCIGRTSCTKENSFTFSDNVTDGQEVSKYWTPGQPDGGNKDKDCVTFYAGSSQKKSGWSSGKYYSGKCLEKEHNNDGKAMKIVGYACGKPSRSVIHGHA